MSLSAVPESGRAATGLFPTLLEHVYDPNVKYRPVSPLHQEEGEVLFTHAIPAKKVWDQQKAFIYEHKPQEKGNPNLKSSDGFSLITETTKWPHSTHVQLTIQFKNKIYGGSGALVGPHHVLTCGQHVHEDEWADSITVYPALNDNAPFRACKVVKAYTFTQWTQQKKDPCYNIALLILNESIGEITGWNGLLCTPDSYLLNEEVNIVGYSVDKNFTEMWSTKHKVQKIEPEKFDYSNETQATSSGSAICINKWNTSMIVGIQALGRDHQQFGIRLTRQKLEVLAQKIAGGFKIYPSIAFGKAEWEKFFGDVGAEPLLPSNIDEILNGPCPSLPGKKVFETHLLTLIPATVNNQPFTLQTLGKLIEHPKTGHATKFKDFDLGKYKDNRERASYWILMSRDVLKESYGEDYETQNKRVNELGKKIGVSYALPKVLEAATCILMHHVSTETGEKLYPVRTYTRCKEFHYQDKEFNWNWKLTVGNFDAGGLEVSNGGMLGFDFTGTCGVAICRKL